MNNNQPILTVNNVVKSYKTGARTVHVLKGVNLEIQYGECVLLLGPSGSGKSTFLHIAGGLDRPDEGRVFIENRDLYQLKDKKRGVCEEQRYRLCVPVLQSAA